MATSHKAGRDWAYLFIIGTQLFGMLVLDLSRFYPSSLWKPSPSPFHFIHTIQSLYISTSHDPFFTNPHPDPWFDIFLYIEGLVQLPLAVYLVYQLASKRPTSGPAELAALVFACVTAMGAAACCFELWCMGEERVSAEKKGMLLYGTYLPFAVMPTIMAVDMYMRLLPRVQSSEEKRKTQ